MSAIQERRGATIGVVVALLILALTIGLGFVASSGEPETSGLPLADESEPLPGGVRTDVVDATRAFPVPLFRPSVPAASDSTIAELWMRLEGSPEVWIQYESGIVVLIRPIGDLQPTDEFAKAQIAEGVPGRVAPVAGVDAFVVPQTEQGSGSVRLVLDGVLVTVVGYAGDFSEKELTDAAESVVRTSAEVAASAEA